MAKSIMQAEKKCYITGETRYLHKHHIYAGKNRKISEDNGFWVYLVSWLHNQSDEGVHCKNGHELDNKLKTECQAKFEETHTRAAFLALIGKNYL